MEVQNKKGVKKVRKSTNNLKDRDKRYRELNK